MDPLPSALQTLALDEPKQWSQVRIWLDFLKTFLTFIPEWSTAASATDGAREHLRHLPSLVNSEFENSERDIEDAVKKGDTAKLDELQSELVQKMDHYKPKIRDAYNFLSGYVFQNNTLSDVVLGNQQWFPSYASLLENCKRLNCNYPLYNELMSVLEFPESLRLRQIMFRDREMFKDLCIQHGGLAICLAGLMFSWWAKEGEDATSSAKAKLSDLVLKIKPGTSDSGLMVQYLEAIKSQIHSLQENLMKELVGIILLSPNGLNPPHETDSLVFLIKHLVDSGEEDAEIGRIVWSAAFEEAEMLRTKTLLIELGDRETVRQRPRFEDIYSENMMQILEEIETLMISGAEAETFKIGGGSVDPYVKVSVDFYIAVFQAFLTELMSRSSILILDVKSQVQKLSHESKRFRRFSSILPLKNQVDMELISSLMMVATSEAETLHEFFQSTLVMEENMSDLSRLLSDFLEHLRNLNDKVEEIYLKFRELSMVSFPETLPGLSFVDSFLERLSGMADKAFPGGYCVNSQIEAVLEGENSLAEVLKKVGEKQNEDSDLIKLKRRVTQAAYEADYIIDTMLVLDADKCHLLWLSDAVNEMNLVKEDLMKFCGEKKHLVQVQGSTKILHHKESAQSHETPEVGEFIVPLDDQVSQVTELLTNGKSEKFMVGIVGTPGIGKTTLARTAYDRVKSHFQKHAWCTISQEFLMKDVLLKILHDIDPKLVEDLKDSDDEDALLQKLYTYLRGKSYLIVMDDMWTDAAWKGLEKLMPEPQSKSRILFTSRIETVLSSYKESVNIYSPRPLSDDESWNLIQRRMFGENHNCPEGLRIVGQDIARSCKGLPLAVVAVSGLLRKKEQEHHVWDEIKQHLSSTISAESQCNKILELSYNHLPDYLKPCLLYFAAFREDQEIQVNRLIRLWISEGLIRQVHPEPEPEPKEQNNARQVVDDDDDDDDDDGGCFVSAVVENKGDDQAEAKYNTLEDVALEYVDDLTSRSLIMAARRGSTNKVKACKIHDLLHNLCLAKAEKNNFFESITDYSKLYPSNTEDHGVDIKPISGTSPPSYINKHRLGIFSKRNQFVNLQPSGQPVRTLLFSATTDTHPTCPYDVSFIPRNFKILKVLDIEGINMDSSFPEKILDLDPLRYLAVGGDINSIPPNIQNLWNLENFTVRGLKGKVSLPGTIWSLSKLRHLHVYPGLTFDFKDENSSQLNNLMTLSSPALSQWTDLEAIIGKAPQLQKLKCTFSPDQYSSECIGFVYPEDFLNLESLKVLYTGHFLEPWNLSFPSNLKKLSLKSFRLTCECISAIGELCRLEVLTLVSISFDDSNWEMGENEFQELKVLKLDSMELQEWVVPSTNFGVLEQLVLRNCEHLHQIPHAFAEIATLKMVELMRVSSSAKISLEKIKKEQIKEFARDHFTTTIK